MASSPTEPGSTASPAAFALAEATACWNQGYEALLRGDLERVATMLDIAAEHLRSVGNADGDSAEVARCREAATAARGRLEHGVRAGMDGLTQEMAQTRRGAKALRGYSDPTLGVGTIVRQSV